MIEKIILLLSSLAFMIILAKVTDEFSYGAIAYAQSIVGMLVFMITMGFDSVVIKELVHNKNNTRKVLFNIFFVRCLMFICVFGIIYYYSYIFVDSSLIKELILIQSFTLTYYVFFSFGLHFQATVSNSVITKAKVFIGLSVLVIKIIMVILDVKIYCYVIADACSMMLQGFVVFLLYLQEEKKLDLVALNNKRLFDFSLIKSLFLQSWPLMISSASILIYARIDQFMVGNIVSIEELAKYSISVKISESWYFIPSIISMVLFPVLVSSKSKSESEYINIFGKITFVMFWLSIICSLIVVFCLSPILVYFFDKKYDGFIYSVYILTISGCFVSLGFANGRWLICEGLLKFELLRCVIGAIINIGLNFILITKLGMIGAAISTLISVAISSYLLLFFFSSTRNLAILQMCSIFNFRYLEGFTNKFIVKIK